MHDIKLIRANPEEFEKQMARRGVISLTEDIIRIDKLIRESKIKILKIMNMFILLMDQHYR